ncbi:MAG: T9SS type A sorting domain-containing protein [Chloroflexi bacterium]|nr:MAG: T9SS type A sorting domain-containing protein [Chloroflexota bacterium]
MATTTDPARREPARRDDTIRMQRWLRTPAVSMAKALANASANASMAWWNRQARQTRTGLVVAALFVLAGTFSLCASLSKPAGLSAAVDSVVKVASNAPPLVQEASAPDAGKVWAVTKIWQGTGGKETEMFTVTGHWRVDWIFSPTSSTSLFQVFIYASDGRTLMNMAANSKGGGSDTSFWAGPGTYFLKINSNGGDWKVDVQDLH